MLEQWYNALLQLLFAGFEPVELFAILMLFVWGGFVRGAFSFGGAALTLPLLLLVYPDPLFFIPIIAIQLLVIAFVRVVFHSRLINFRVLWRSVLILLPTKIIGIIGLLQMPNDILILIIFGFSVFYAVTYLVRGTVQPSKGKKITLFDYAAMGLGGYMSGTALSGAPLIVGVVGKYVAKESLRSTLFALWIVLVLIKLTAMMLAGVSMQLEHQLWLFPAGIIGHLLGVRCSRILHHMPEHVYYRALGAVMLVVGGSGVVSVFIFH